MMNKVTDLIKERKITPKIADEVRNETISIIKTLNFVSPETKMSLISEIQGMSVSDLIKNLSAQEKMKRRLQE